MINCIYIFMSMLAGFLAGGIFVMNQVTAQRRRINKRLEKAMAAKNVTFDSSFNSLCEAYNEAAE